MERTSTGPAAIEENIVEFFRAFGKVAPNATVHDAADVFYSLTSVAFPVFNSVLRARLSAAEAETTIASLRAAARERNVPLLWWVGPGSSPSDLGRRLVARGFAHASTLPGMSADLDALAEPEPGTPELTIARVTDASTARLWAKLLCDGFAMPQFAGDALYDFTLATGFSHEAPLRNYVAWWNGMPVATSSLFTAAGVAGIYNVATVRAARHRGVGRAMTLRAMLDAKNRGFRAAILQASSAGIRVYESLGFESICAFEHYACSPS